MAADFFLGESLVGDGNEVAHIDLIIGSKSGPAGAAFCNALDEQQGRLHHAARGRRAEPAGQARHDPVQQGHDQGRQAGGADVRTGAGRGGPRGRRLGRERRHPEGQGRRLCILVGVFIHWDASDDKKIYDYNYQATKESIAARAGRQAERRRGDRRLEDGEAPVQPEVDAERQPRTGRDRGIAVRSRLRCIPSLPDRSVRKLLLQLDTSPHPSVFDRVVAFDGGADEVMSYGGVTEDAVRDLVHGAIFTRGPKDLHNTAIFVGGTDMAAGERLLAAVQKAFFGPLRVSVMLDSNGSNTTAVAAVAKLQQAAGDVARPSRRRHRRHRPGRPARRRSARQGGRRRRDHLAQAGGSGDRSTAAPAAVRRHDARRSRWPDSVAGRRACSRAPSCCSTPAPPACCSCRAPRGPAAPACGPPPTSTPSRRSASKAIEVTDDGVERDGVTVVRRARRRQAQDEDPQGLHRPPVRAQRSVLDAEIDCARSPRPLG